MRILFFGSLCLLFVSVFQLLPEAQAAGTGYYVAPNGSGSSCTRQSPCSLTAGINKAQAGDEVVLMDGTYTIPSGSVTISKNNIMVRALNKHAATIKAGSSHTSWLFTISGDNVTIRNLVFETRFIGGTGVRLYMANRPVVEGNIIRNAGVTINPGTHNAIVRHNLIENSQGECFYISARGGNSSQPSDADNITNLEVYGNTVRKCASNLFDLKTSKNAKVHHNIFEGQYHLDTPPADDGCIRTNAGTLNSRIHDNIVRDSRCGSQFGALSAMIPGFGNIITNNVFLNLPDTAAVHWHGSDSRPSGETRITDNTWCNTGTAVRAHKGGTGIPSGIIFTGNKTNAPISECNAEVQRIMNEMKNLPPFDNAPPVTPLTPSNLRVVGN